MSAGPRPIAILHTGLVTSVGLSAPATCAAIRAAVTNHTETRFIGAGGEWIVAAQVPLDQPWRGREKLVQMLALAVGECIESCGPPEPRTLPLLLCVAEQERPGRPEGLDDRLPGELTERTGIEFHPEFSSVVAYGRVSAAVALSRARDLIHQRGAPRVLIAAADSLLRWPTLSAYYEQGRLLVPGNSNGFVPGEAAGAVMVAGRPGPGPQLFCTGLGFSQEQATILSETPLRADGLAAAIKGALADAGCAMHDLDFRITDATGEHYYFKEAALALSRVLRQRKENFDIWHPTDCVGETGAAVGVIALAVALAACRKGYTVGPNILLHSGNDAGQRAAAVLRYREKA
jgi:3-oxoacyl-[acyl-carrier-protein] synthase I